jgi:hypothetical protein
MQSYTQCLSNIQIDPEYSPTFFDVGCNINQIPSHCGVLDDFTELVLSQYQNARCFGIDPLHWQAYEQKYKNDPRVTVIKQALSDSEDKKTLYIPGSFQEFKGHAISSFYKRSCFDENHGIEEVEVECITLDLLLSKLNIDILDYLKIDTEGAELLILNGAKESLENKKINCIQIEYGVPYEDTGYSIQDILDYLNQYEYIEIFRTGTEHGEILFTNKNCLN